MYGIDLGKNVFYVIGADATGNVVQRARSAVTHCLHSAHGAGTGRNGSLPWVAMAGQKVTGDGAFCPYCPGSIVKPYVKSNKNDAIDAAAIAKALNSSHNAFCRRQTARPSGLTGPSRIRDQMVGGRTRLICQKRAFCLEYGVPIRQGAGVFKIDLPRVVADELNDLTSTMRRLLLELFEDLKRLEVRIAEVTREIEGLAGSNEKARRLMTIPGIGPIAATALLAATGNGQQFRKARDMATWLGLVPQQYSTGGKTQMRGISKRGICLLKSPYQML